MVYTFYGLHYYNYLKIKYLNIIYPQKVGLHVNPLFEGKRPQDQGVMLLN